MRVGEIMKKNVATVSRDTTAVIARETMKRSRIRHLVVTEGSEIVGVLSDRDLRGVRDEEADDVTVGETMTPYAVKARPGMPLRQAANLMRGWTIGCLPVVENERLVGIITTSDLLEIIGRGLVKPLETQERKVLPRRAPRVKPKIARG